MKFFKGGDVTHQIEKMLNQGLRLDDNFDGAMIEFDFEAGDNEVHHSLGRVPLGVIVLLKSEPGEIYGTRLREWTNEIIYLKSAASNPKVRLFVV